MTTLTVQLRNSVFSRDAKRLKRLNSLLAKHTTFSPTLIMSATSCQLTDALAVLVLLWEKHLTEGYLLVYHREEHEIPLFRLPLSGGLPQVPFIFDGEYGTRRVESEAELFYSFEFDLVNEEDTVQILIANDESE